MSALAQALLADLDDHALDQLALLLAPRLHPETNHGGWLRGADKIANYIDAPRSRVYALASANRIPIVRDGTALLAQTHELDQWIRNGGGKRP